MPGQPARSELSFNLAALFLGLLQALSFAPLALGLLQTLSFSGLCLLILFRPDRAGMLAWLFGLATFSAGLSWMFISMHRFGGMPSPMAALAVVLLSSYLALFGAVAWRLAISAGGITGNHGNGAAGFYSLPLIIAAFWVLGEMARGILLTGFPWLSIGYAHVDNPLSGTAAWAGVYGISGIAVLISALLARLIHHLIQQRMQKKQPDVAIPETSLRQEVGPTTFGSTSLTTRLTRSTMMPALTILMAILMIIGVSVLAGQQAFSTNDGKPVSVRLLQGNVEQQLKFDPGRTLRAMRDYIALVRQAPAQLYVLPETAWTVGLAQTPPQILSSLSAYLRKNGGLFATGIPVREPSPQGQNPYRLTNSVVTLDANLEITARYNKRHLVPFGEFIPPGFRWFVDMMHIPLGDFDRGGRQQPPLVLDGRRVAFNICYEDLFGEELAVQVRDGANLLINVSNIGWFGQSHALPQHLNISRLRAMEFQRPMLRSTNTGVTAHIGPSGRVLAQLPVYQHGALDVNVQPMTGLTPFARYGLWLPTTLAVILLLTGTMMQLIGPRKTD
ncbi:MAG: apolipoprotein N-acyltransferase [Burkholderiaceae bacterium]